MKTYTIRLETYNVDSSFQIDLTPKEYELMKTIEKAIAKLNVGLVVKPMGMTRS